MPLGELLDQAAGLLVIEHRPKHRDPWRAADALDHALGAEREILAGDGVQPLTEQASESGLVLGRPADEEEGHHGQTLLPSVRTEPLVSVLSFSSVNHICA